MALVAAPTGTGIGWRQELAADLLREPERIGFVEVVAEACFASRPLFNEARAIAHLWPVIPHGVKLSLGSPDGIDDAQARRLGELATALGSPLVSEHVAITRGGGLEIGHLTPLPRTRATVEVVANNVARVRRCLPVPLLLENIAAPFDWPEDELDEGDFYRAIVDATGCGLLLDVANLYANAVNRGQDPQALLARFPLDAVAMVHIAGGTVDDGFYFDTHAHDVPEAVFDLLATVMGRCGPVPVLLERDARFDDASAVLRELERCRVIQGRAAPRPLSASTPRAVIAPRDDDQATASPGLLADRTARLAALLAHPAVDTTNTLGIDPRGLQRARDILRRKRVDDAVALLPRLARRGDELMRLALQALVAVVRAPVGNAVPDAWHIAVAASGHPAFVDDALVDSLLLRARFGPRPATVTPSPPRRVLPRRTPFLGRTTLPDGRIVTALKGPGVGARIRLFEPPSPSLAAIRDPVEST